MSDGAFSLGSEEGSQRSNVTSSILKIDKITEDARSSVIIPSESRKINPNVAALTVNKLRVSSLGLHGREIEQRALKECFDNTSEKRQLVFVKGVSGAGKTSLVSSLRNPTKQRLGIFAMGKFDMELTDKPYASIIEACNNICCEIAAVSTDPTRVSSFKDLQSELFNSISNEITLLTTMIPMLNMIVEDRSRRSIDEETKEEDSSLEHAKARLHHTFRCFFRVICSHLGPLVLVLDDLQWADPASLELMEVLVTDRNITKLMVIGLYRSNEVAEGDLLSNTIRRQRESASEYDFSFTEIEVKDFDVDSINGVIMSLLGIDDPSRTFELAEVCHRRTNGNVFFLIEFLRMLDEEGFLEFNLGLFQWTWDIGRINTETTPTKNVVELMRNKMIRHSQEFQSLLTTAACLGSSFERGKLEMVWVGSDSAPPSAEASENLLLQGVREGFLETHDGSHFQWIHDSVQEAAFSLVAANIVNDLKYQVGKRLLSTLNEDERETHIFAIVELLSCHNVDDLGATDKVMMATLYMEAAQKAKSMSAFCTAVRYTRLGIGILPGDHWRDHQELSLELYSTAAEVEGCTGNAIEMQEVCHEVFKQVHVPILSKLRAYNAHLEFLTFQGQHKEAIKLSLEVLHQLGFHIPRSSLGLKRAAAVSLIRARLSLKSRTATEAMTLPKMTDSRQIEIVKILYRLAIPCYLTGQVDLMGLSYAKSFELTIRHGLHETSPCAASCVGIVFLAAFDDLVAATRIGEYALLLQQRTDIRQLLARTNMSLYPYVFAWTKPMRTIFKPLFEGYEHGMASGDVSSAIICISLYCCCGNNAGRHLGTQNEDFTLYVRQMRDLQNEQMLQTCRVCWQATQNLMGLSPNTSLMQGLVIENIQELLSDWKENASFMSIYIVTQELLYIFFGDHELCTEFAEKYGLYHSKHQPAAPGIFPEVFYQGFSLYVCAQRSGRKRKHKKMAIYRHKLLKTWARKGNPNVIHLDLFLDAERAVLERKVEVALKKYREAVVIAVRGGFIHHAALFHERLGDYEWNELRDAKEAAYHYQESIKLFDEWGATRKVQLVLEKTKCISDVDVAVLQSKSRRS